MAQLTWDALTPMDTSKYLDAIQKAQAQSVAGVDQIGAAYKGYHDNLKKQNTNDMLTALNQAQNPEELAIAQANIAAMQQRWGSGYDMDAVRTAVDERPATLMQRQSAEMDFNDKQANLAARPEVSAIHMAQLKSLGAKDEELARIKAMADSGVDTTAIADSYGQFLTNDRNFTNENYWKLKNFNQSADQFEKTFNQGAYEFDQTNDRANRESALNAGKALNDAEQASGAGTVQVAADGSEFTTGGGGAAALAGYASMFMPSGVRQAIFKGESGGDYDTLYGNSHRAGGKFAGVKLTNMTVNEALEFSKAGGDYARWSKTQKGVKPGTYATPMGAYQVVGTTLQNAVKALGLKGDEKMTPELQDKIGDYIYQTQGTNAWKGYRGPVQGGGGYKPGNTPSNAPASAPMVGIDRKVQQKIRSEYQNAMLKYNEELALKDQPVNVGNVLAGLTAKEKGQPWTQDAFNIAAALKDNPQLKGLSAEGITNVFNRARSWQAKSGVPWIGYNSAAGLNASIDSYIEDEIGIEAQRKKHVAKATHPSNLYVQKIQQEFEAKGVSISAKEALLHVDPDRYEALHGTPSVKVQEALDKKVDKVEGETPKSTPVVKPEPAKPVPKFEPKPFDKLIPSSADPKAKTAFDKKYEQIKESEQKAIQASKAAASAKKAQELREIAVKKRREADILVKRAREDAARKAQEELRKKKARLERQGNQLPATSGQWIESDAVKEILKRNR